MSTEHRPAFRAGEWTVEPDLNALRFGDVERHVEPKVMKVLLALAEHPNRVVSKEDLMAAVWPGTFVGDDALTRCISVLRRVTRDDPSTPHFIQTVPKVGYRLVAEVQELSQPPADLLHPESSLPAAQKMQEAALAPSVSSRSSSWLRPLLAVAAAFVFLGLITALVMRPFRAGDSRETVLATLPFTSRDGEQLQPAFSPDGATVAYVAIPEEGGPQHIFLKKIGSDTSTALTAGSGDDFSPVWSPDGARLAYLSRSSEGLGIFLVDVHSKAARKIFVPQATSQWEGGALTWSPDGNSLAFPDHAGTSPSSAIVLLDLQTLRTQVLTTPPEGWEGDLTPAFSPDGKRIAFSRASETAVRDLYWVGVTGGDVHAITHEASNIGSLAWSPDGKSIVFSSTRGGKSALWRVALRNGTPQRMGVGTEDAAQPAIVRVGDVTRIAYTQGSAIWSIQSIARGSNRIATEVLSSTQEDSAPSFSRDGTRFAFQSQRSGFQEIWEAAADGSGAHPLTHRNGPLTGSPAWGHVQDSILFDSRTGGHSHVFVVGASGGEPRQLSFGDFNDITPRWSADDTTIFFRSNRGGRWQIWRMNRDGSGTEPVTTGDGIVPQQSSDGTSLYFTRGGDPGIWQVPLNGGAETQLLPQPSAGYWGYWEVTPQGILYLDTSDATLRLYNTATRTSSVFATLKHLPPRFAGLSVRPDEREALFTDESHASRHITLSEISVH